MQLLFVSAPFHRIHQREFSLQDLSLFFWHPCQNCDLHLHSLHHWHDLPKIHPCLQQSQTSSKTSKTSKFRFPTAPGLTLFASILAYLHCSHISLIVLFAFAIWVKYRHICKNYIQADGSQMEGVKPSSPQESSWALCNWASCCLLLNYQEFNILESSVTAIDNWNHPKCSKAGVAYVGKGEGDKRFQCMVSLMRYWQSMVVMLKIFLGVLSLSDPGRAP